MNRSLCALGNNFKYLQPAPNTFGLLAQCFGIRFDGGMHEQRFPRTAGNDMKVHMWNRLARGRAIYLGDHDARRIERSLYSCGNVLRSAYTGGGTVRREIEQSFGRLPRDHERMPLGLRHEVHEGERVLVLKESNAR